MSDDPVPAEANTGLIWVNDQPRDRFTLVASGSLRQWEVHRPSTLATEKMQDAGWGVCEMARGGDPRFRLGSQRPTD